MVGRRILAALVTLVLFAATGSAQDGKKNFLWRVEGPGGSVAYLLGSLHVLTPDFYPLSPEINQAFAGAKTLVEEIDLDEMTDPAQMRNALGKAMLTDGRTLEQLIAPATFAEVARRAQSFGLPMASLQRMKPWLVAITLLEPSLQAAGFKADLGIDQHFFDRAKAGGLKRQAQQWAAGDIKGLEKSLLVSFADSPELYARLLVERNRNWVPHVDACLTNNSGCFIVVGAAHLVGPDGLPTLLAKQGHKVTQQ